MAAMKAARCPAATRIVYCAQIDTQSAITCGVTATSCRAAV